MLKRTVLGLPLAALTLASGLSFAQSQDASKANEPPKFYRLEFVVKEVDGGKVLNTRTYSITVSTDPRDSSTQIRAGGRVPIQTTTAGPTSIQYLDIGVNIDCSNVKEVDRGLSLRVSADISSVPSEPAASTTGPPLPPTLRQNRWAAMTIVPLKKPTLIFSSDDPTSKRQMQLELTATSIL